MKKIKSIRTVSFILWCIISILSVILLPNMDKLTREHGELTLPKSTNVVIADSLLNKVNNDHSELLTFIAVFTSGTGKALTSEQIAEVDKSIMTLKEDKDKLGIDNLITYLDGDEFEEQLVSEKKETILTQISVKKNFGEIAELRDGISHAIKVEGLESYLTGSDLIREDLIISTQEGVTKTEAIAVIFILIILIIVFRSPVVPFVSLLTVGVSYIVSLSLVTNLVEHMNYPFSNFTQIFLVVVLFGIGTDYNILIYKRFKEELGIQDDVLTAMKVTMKSSGKSVIFSGIAVFIGFATLYLAKFSFYQATSAVAIGVGVLLLVLITLNPFFMVILGKKMFYPTKSFTGHADSKIWGSITKFSIKRPLISILIFALITVPFFLMYSNNSSYNDLLEVNDKYESKQGISIIQEHFAPGFSSPLTLVLESKNTLDNASTLQVLDELSNKISNMDGISKVLSVTRPAGEKISDLYINKQAGELKSGIEEAGEGVDEIHGGLSDVKDELSSSSKDDLSNVQLLIDGTTDLKNGVTAVVGAVSQLKEGFSNGAEGAKQLENGLQEVNKNLAAISSGTSQLHNGYQQLANGLSTYDKYFSGISAAIDAAMKGYQQIEALMGQFVAANPDKAADTSIQTTLAIASQAQEQLAVLLNQLNQLSTEHLVVMHSFNESNSALELVVGGLGQLQSGISQLQSGAEELKGGLNKGVSGSDLIVTSAQDMDNGFDRVNDGQKQLLTGLSKLQDNMNDLKKGLGETTDGLDQIRDGLNSAEEYLGSLSESKGSQKLYIPEEVLESKDFKEIMDAYMSENRKLTTMSIILSENPFSKEAMPIVEKVNALVGSTLEGTEVEVSSYGTYGTTALNAELKEIAQSDFIRTAIIMLIGILIVLIIIMKSVANSIYIVVSLALSYFSAMGITEFLSKQILNTDNLTWNVPFFSFILIITLGVDYSIFMMMRFNELEGSISTRILNASKNIGEVIISAAIILGGTFAAMIPSGVLTLIQVAMVIVIGLILLSFFAFPLFVPALMALVEKVKGRFQNN